ncbi:BMC domain-containing protein [Gloeocapsopsis crepidinum LEGE 06123]|uniref:BMC domain-containing protein n=1 Tax=Gloeocapsopsis crepidinum LEGE 06123 TaxID=588587 RepID=A0ABR9UWP8_9CHRO|nr:BMC domain-containing protein [Gloeocapsopsis crepidinum]MBE9192724.1 BMC domain-containing protein [Gloeocapsopsis crepidinum LEGE 06123]
METPNQGYAPREQFSRKDDLRESALGLVSTLSFPAIIQTADAMLKSSEVTLVGFEKIGSGHCTAIVRGKVASIRLAVEAGAQTAAEFGQLVSTLVIPRPLPNLDVVFPIGNRLSDLAQFERDIRVSSQAIGLLETRGFPVMVGAADAMLKAADVKLMSYEKIGAGLCTAIIRGAVADVVVAVEAGMQEALRIDANSLNAVTVIPRPLDDLEQNLPLASCLLEEQPKPLKLPVAIKDKTPEAELIKLPDLATIPVEINQVEIDQEE